MRLAVTPLLLLGLPAAAIAGMPAPLPVDPKRTFRLTDLAALRLQSISFFILLFFLSAFSLWLIWKWLRKDFPVLPRLSFPRAVAAVFLWGLLFVIVLAMISGARELMTPGAWKRDGATYQLTGDPGRAASSDPESARRRQLEQLRTALWQFAAIHGGQFPTEAELSAIPRDVWEVPEGGGLRFRYVPGRKAGYSPEVLVYEPELDPDRRLVLDTAGDIRVMPSAELRPLVPEGGQP